MAAITGEAVANADSGPGGAAAAISALLDQIVVLSAGEKHLLAELLDRVANAA